jgi:hypothetical protein
MESSFSRTLRRVMFNKCIPALFMPLSAAVTRCSMSFHHAVNSASGRKYSLSRNVSS